MNALRRAAFLLSFVFLIAGADRVLAQCVSLTTLASAYTQNFDTLSNTAGSTTNNLTITGWFMTEGGGGARDNEQYGVDTGSSTTGDTYSYGAAAATERALGQLRSGTLIPLFGSCYTNNTGATITSLDIAYTGEEWRLGTAPPSRTIPDQMNFEYSLNATDLTTGAWTNVAALNFVTPDNATVGAKNGNGSGDRTMLSNSIASLAIPNGATFWIRWNDQDATGADDGLAVDDFSLTPQGGVINSPVVPNCPTPITTTFGNATSGPVSATDADGTVVSATITGITPSDPGTITLTGFTPAGGVGGTANATLNVSNTTPANTYSVTIQWANNDGSPQTANCVVGVTVNPAPVLAKIHDVQGNGSATPIPGTTVTVEGVVTANFQGTGKLQGFFLEEEDADADADPATSEGIFIFCNTCPTPVAEGQRVQATGTVSEFNTVTEITASTAGSVVVTDAANHLAEVTPSPIDLPIAGVVNDFYEARESMKVTFVDTLTVSEYFELFRYGQIELFEGGRPYQFTEHNAPSVAGNNAQIDDLNRRRVTLDDENNIEEWPLTFPNGQQATFHPRANGGFSVGTQGTDFFRGGDLVNGLTGVLHWSFAGVTGTDTWRIRPTAANPATFTVADPRPVTPPNPGGAIRAVGMNMLNYFTTIDTTSSNNSGPCGPGGTLDCRGADSVAELNRQRERASVVICDLNPDVAGLMEMENTTATTTINDLLGAVNARCGGANPYTFVNTGGTLGTDAIRVFIIYRTGVLSPVGSPLVDLDPVHNRPPTAQTFDVVAATNAAFGQRFTIIANHFKSKGCPGTGADADAGDGQGCFNGSRVDQANRLLTWINGTVVPTAGDPDVLLVGDFNSYAHEDPVTALQGGGFTDLTTQFIGPSTYSYLFDGQLGHLDYGFASASLLPQVTGADDWHINADEVPLFDYSDEVKDTGESAFEEKPDGSALVPPRVVFAPGTPYRASDHDPVVVGLFAAADLVVTKGDSPDPVTAGSNLTYTITVANNGPDAASTASWSDTLPAGTTFVSMPAVPGWTCTTPAVGAGGTVSCSNSLFAVGSSLFTLTVNVDPSVAAGTVLSNTATATSATADPDSSNNAPTATTTVATSADLSVTKVDTPDPVNAGSNITYNITANNAGPSNAATVIVSDTLPAGTTFVSLSSPGGWSCSAPAVGASGTVTCSIASMSAGNAVFTLVVNVGASVADATVITNSATVSSATSDPNGGNETGVATTTVATSADLLLSKTDTPDPVNAGANLTYQLTLTNSGPSNATNATFSDTLPTGTYFVSLSTTGAWSCTTPAVNSPGTVSCTNASFGPTVDFFTLVVGVGSNVAPGTVLSNTASLSTSTTDPNGANNSDTATSTVSTSSDMQVTKVDTPDPVTPGSNLSYAITITNAGPSDASGTTFSDTIPANTTFVSLATFADFSCTTPAVGGAGTISCSKPSLFVAGSSGVFTLVVNVGAATAGGTIITNTATVGATTSDPSSGNNSATATTTVGVGSADISVTKSDSPDPVTAGNNLTYTISLTNAGPTNATSAAFNDTLPTGTTFVSLTSPGGWSCTTPAVGGTGTVACTNPSLGLTTANFTLVVNVNSSVTAGTVITNTANSSSATSDPNAANNSAVATTAVTASTDLSITKSDSPDPVNAGANLTYTISVTNAGPSNAAAAAMSDTLPTGTTFVSLTSPGGWSCTTPAVDATGTVSCTNPSLGVTTANFTLVVAVAPATPAGTTITNTANIATTTTDANPGNNSATSTTSVLSPATITATKTASGSFQPGGAITYTIVISNSGPSTQQDNSGHEFTDVLPAALDLVSASATSGSAVATVATNTVTWDGSIPAGGSVTITIHATIDPAATPGTSISNQGTTSYDSNGDGTNDASGTTDDPAASGAANPTSFTVTSGATATAPIPTLDARALLALCALLAVAALAILKR